MQQDHDKSGGAVFSSEASPNKGEASRSPLSVAGHAAPPSPSSQAPVSLMGTAVQSQASASASSSGSSPPTYSAEMLARIQARKKLNHAARVQEFALLRQVRQQMPLHGVHVGRDLLASSPQGTASAATARDAGTLQKINAIEAQLARQWWQAYPQPAGTVAATMDAAAQPKLSLPSEAAEQAARPGGMSEAQWKAIPTLGIENALPPKADEATPVASPSLPAEVEPRYVVPEVEDAAILFAHGSFDAAKASLLQLLVQALDATPSDPARVRDIWLMVLDVYRATNDADGFEPLAWDYAAHFSCPVPEWYGLAEKMGLAPLAGAAAGEESGEPDVPLTSSCDWHAPVVLGLDAVLALDAVVLSRPTPWRLDWSALKEIESVTLPLLLRVVEGWVRHPGSFVCMGSAALRKVMESYTGLGQRSVSSQWWMLHLMLLRWLNEPQAFEQVALNYCITYEVSAPAWEASASECVQQGRTPPGQAQTWVVPAHWAGVPALVGVLEGDLTVLLAALATHQRDDEVLDINCEALIRMDLIAVASLMQWCLARHAQGHRMRFLQVRSWIAVLWQLMGLHAYARIQPLLTTT